MTSYDVIARRWARGWELHITDHHGAHLGVTQARRLTEAERMVRDYLALDEHPDADTAPLTIRAELGAELDSITTAARQAVHDAEQAQRDAAAQSRAAVRELKAAGLSGAEIAAVLDVSPQRVSQLVNS